MIERIAWSRSLGVRRLHPKSYFADSSAISSRSAAGALNAFRKSSTLNVCHFVSFTALSHYSDDFPTTKIIS